MSSYFQGFQKSFVLGRLVLDRQKPVTNIIESSEHIYQHRLAGWDWQKIIFAVGTWGLHICFASNFCSNWTFEQLYSITTPDLWPLASKNATINKGVRVVGAEPVHPQRKTKTLPRFTGAWIWFTLMCLWLSFCLNGFQKSPFSNRYSVALTWFLSFTSASFKWFFFFF